MTIRVTQFDLRGIMEQMNEADEEYRTFNASETAIGFEQSDLFQKINRLKERHSEVVALFSDFDGTLFSGDISKTAELVGLARQKDVPVVAVTGRGALALKEVVDDLVADYNEQHPEQKVEEINFDAIIGAVGTEIFIARTEDGKTEYRRVDEYEEQMIGQGFVRSEIAHKVAESITEFAQMYPDYSINYQREFIESEKEYLNSGQDAKVQPFKISLEFFASDLGELDFVAKYFQDKFSAQRVVICESIGYNSSLTVEDKKKKYCLDILPVTKAEAVDYLAKKIGVNQGLVAGDSGNDSSMLTDSDKLVAVLVGGHKDEARASINQAVIDEPNRKGRKFQSISQSGGGSKRVYIGENDKPGPKSIMHVAEVYKRAAKIKAIRDAVDNNGNTE